MKAQVPTHRVIIASRPCQHSHTSFAICSLISHNSPSGSHSFTLLPFNTQTKKKYGLRSDGLGIFPLSFFFVQLRLFLLPKTNVSGAPFNLACQTASFKGNLEMLYMCDRRQRQKAQAEQEVMLKETVRNVSCVHLSSCDIAVLMMDTCIPGLERNGHSGSGHFQTMD